MTYESFTATLALIGIVVIVASLLSGAVERTGLPQGAIFLLLGAALGPAAPAREVGSHAVGLFLLGPMFGVFAGWLAITLLDQVRRRVGVRRDYESLYALGVAFTAFAAAEAVGGSGFLAAFAAGLMIA